MHTALSWNVDSVCMMNLLSTPDSGAPAFRLWGQAGGCVRGPGRCWLHFKLVGARARASLRRHCNWRLHPLPAPAALKSACRATATRRLPRRFPCRRPRCLYGEPHRSPAAPHSSSFSCRGNVCSGVQAARARTQVARNAHRSSPLSTLARLSRFTLPAATQHPVSRGHLRNREQHTGPHRELHSVPSW